MPNKHTQTDKMAYRHEKLPKMRQNWPKNSRNEQKISLKIKWKEGRGFLNTLLTVSIVLDRNIALWWHHVIFQRNNVVKIVFNVKTYFVLDRQLSCPMIWQILICGYISLQFCPKIFPKLLIPLFFAFICPIRPTFSSMCPKKTIFAFIWPKLTCFAFICPKMAFSNMDG